MALPRPLLPGLAADAPDLDPTRASGPPDSTFGRWLGVSGTLPDELAALGVAPDDVYDVILTHVHSDHTGWNTTPSSSGWVPRFSNARYYLRDADVAWMRGFIDEEDVRRSSRGDRPLESAGQLDASIEDRELSPGLSLRHAPVHAGHRCVLLDAGGEQVRLRQRPLALHVPAERPEFRSPGDDDPEEGEPHTGHGSIERSRRG